MSNKSTTNNSNETSPSNSISLIRLDELSSFGATKQSRLPALIKLNTIDQNQQQVAAAPSSMPDFSAAELEKQKQIANVDKQRSLPVELSSNLSERVSGQQKVIDENQQEKMPTLETSENNNKQQETVAEKENVAMNADESDDFQVVDMQQDESTDVLIGPSLPAPKDQQQQQPSSILSKEQIDKSINALQSSLAAAGNATNSTVHLGDSLIEMIINLRNENQNLIRALETNNEYVKDRLSEFKRVQEDSKKREAQFAIEKAEFEHQTRKLQRQNLVLSDRLKSMESKLKDMKLEVSESLNAATSSKASSIRDESNQPNLYPLIDPEQESFSNQALMAATTSSQQVQDEDPHQATTMQVDAHSGELYNQGDRHSLTNPAAPDFANMSKEELSKHFDAKKVEFYSLDDPMKQCDKLEQQLNDIGKRDYDICLLQQQLNIYRQDFRLERMEKLEAKIQIERLKNDIDRLCLERLQTASSGDSDNGGQAATITDAVHSHGRRISDGLGKFGHHLTRKAARQAAKAAKYASKQAHLEEKAQAALARVAAARAAATASQNQPASVPMAGQHQTAAKSATVVGGEHSNTHHHGRHHRGHHRHQSGGGSGGIRSEVMSDLLSTANKAMLTGYKMASTHVNLALDKLSQFEQQQASQLEKNKQQTGVAPQQQQQPHATKSTQPSAPMEHPSID